MTINPYLTKNVTNILTDYRFDKYGHSGLSITSSFVLRTLLVFSFIIVIRRILNKKSPFKSDRLHLHSLLYSFLSLILEFQPKSFKTDIATTFEYLSGVLKKKAIVFVLSDFMDEGYEKTLRIVAKKHDLTGIRVFDPIEAILPNLGIVPMQDAETKIVRWINTFSKSTRKIYADAYREKVKKYEELFSKNGAGHLSCSVEESYVKK